MGGYWEILKNKSYKALLAGLLISNLGDRLTELGLVWYLIERHHSSVEVGLTFLIFRLPALITGLLAGWLLDRFRREAVMLAGSILQGFLVISIPLLDSFNLLNLPTIYIILGLFGTISVISTIGSRTLITDMVPPDQYYGANSLNVIQMQISTILGPGLAGLLISGIGPLSLLWIDSFSFFFFGIILIFLLRKPLPYGIREISPTSQVKEPFFRQLLEGVIFTIKSPLLIGLVTISFFWNMGLGIFAVALPFYSAGPLGSGPAGMGMQLTVNSVGVLISAFLFGSIHPRYPGRVVCMMLIAQGICYCLMALTSIFWLVLVIQLLLGGITDLAAIYLTTLRQKFVPAPLQSRVHAFTGTVGPGGEPLGNGLAGILLQSLSSPLVIALSGLPLFCVGLVWLIRGPMKQVKE